MKAISLYLVAAILLLPQIGLSQAVVAGATVSQVFSGISDDLKSLITQAEDSTNIVVMNSRVQASILLQNLELLAGGFENKLFEDLNATERQMFLDAQQLVEQWNSGNTDTLKQLERLNEGLDATLATLPFSKTEPRVLSFGPPYVVGTPNAQHRLAISGRWLGTGEPTLTFEGASCRRIKKLETDLEFECPNSVFSHVATMRPVVGTLLVHRKQGLFEWVSNWFSEDETSRSYEIAVTAVPETVGQYSLVAVVDMEVVERVPRSQSFYHRNDHCVGSRSPTWSVQPATGHEIDIGSVRYNVTTQSENSKLSFVRPSSAAIDIGAIVANNGSCGPKLPFSNSRAGYDARGAVGVTVTWDDIRKTTKVVPNQPMTGTVVWGRDVKVELPSGTKSFVLAVEHSTGELTGADHPGDYKWLRIDRTGDTLLIRPKKPSEVFEG